MPSPRNRLKQTGDTRELQGAYEMDDDLSAELDGSGTQPEAAMFHPAASGLGAEQGTRTLAGGGDSGGSAWRGMSPREYLADAEEQVRSRPLASLGGAFLLGFVLARLTR